MINIYTLSSTFCIICMTVAIILFIASSLLYYFLMKKLDPDFAKAKESLEIDMDRFEIV